MPNQSGSTNPPDTSEPVLRVLNALSGVQRLSRGHYQAPCPLDPKHTLRVIEGADERALVECDDGCWLNELVPALGLTVEDLFRSIDDIYIGSAAPAYPPPMCRAAGAARRM